ncbi:ComEA family DNA-binding protein [Pseudoflavonifractor phocaeensis]|uniref:ComEA family DNA-binding protein n=1 Tax=Pseudoflavonifractor phocaeensis TaxID=1870988 RepID=UPI00195645DF|nr:ComEA family DNA-binding protein [Pseudoflavonifractor phocaeensis]MBM6926255.1 ComEA family DNA-binding protein [Pseudoflavonifractor phocaeensis]
MKISRLELISLLLAVAFGAFAAGWFLRGTGSAQPVRVETRNVLALPAASSTPKPAASVSPAASSSPTVPTESGGLVDLNTATAEELMTLPGIGEKRAADIIADREANGPFRMPEDLTRVSGIGEGILEGLLEYVTVS